MRRHSSSFKRSGPSSRRTVSVPRAEEGQGRPATDEPAGDPSGGDLGPVVKLDAPEQSLLLGAIGYTDDHLRMPPKGKLPPEAVATLTKWVQTGLPFSAEPLVQTKVAERGSGERCCKSEVVLVVPAGEAAGRAGRGGDAVGATRSTRSS